MGQVSINFLRNLIKEESKGGKKQLKAHQVFLYLEEDIDWELPKNFEKRVFLPGFYRRDDLIRKIIWEKFLLPRRVKMDNCQVFFSLYQSVTIFKKIKHLMLVHDTIWKIFPEYLNNSRKKVYYWLVDRAIKKVDKIMTVSENSKQDIIKYFQITAEKIKVNYIDCSNIFKNPGKESAEQIRKVVALKRRKMGEKIVAKQRGIKLPQSYIFYVGGFDKRKNVARLIQAYGLLWQARKKITGKFPHLVIAGKFYPQLIPLITDLPKEIKKVQKKYALPEEMIKLIDYVEEEELPRLYRKAKLFCYPSLYEGFGLPPLQAQNMGCPVVASNSSSLKEILKTGSVLKINPKSKKDIYQAMEKVLTNNELKDKLVEWGKINAQRFSWDSFTEIFLKNII